MLGWWRQRRRRRLAQRPFPEPWRAIVEARLPFAAALEGEDRAAFLEHLKVFVWDKRWEGAGGQVIDDEVQVVIAGAAARLSRRLSLDVYDELRSIVVYPSHYKHPDRDGIILGEAHRFGTVVLSWDAVRHGLANPGDGHDTAVHEFAHVLDVADGEFDGTPPLPSSSDCHRWAQVFSAHYLRLRSETERGRRRGGLLRDYGATNEAEFFACATEAFFEKPRQLHAKAPDLYAELVGYYRVDPRQESRR
jgi:Mlc titration factor MtfA (ptsG expression regulator)